MSHEQTKDPFVLTDEEREARDARIRQRSEKLWWSDEDAQTEHLRLLTELRDLTKHFNENFEDRLRSMRESEGWME